MNLRDLYAQTDPRKHRNIVVLKDTVLVLDDAGAPAADYLLDEEDNLYLVKNHEADKLETATLKAKIDAIEAKLNTLSTKI